MANELTPFNNSEVTDLQALAGHLQEDSQFGARGGNVSYMSFSGKRGRYKIGVDGRQPGENEPFLVATPTFRSGYMCWRGGKAISKRFAGLREPKIMEPDPNEFGPFEKDGDGWSRAKSMVMRSMENGEEVEFSTSSASGVSVVADLQKAILDRMVSGSSSWAVISWDMEEFESKGYKNFKPVVTIHGWLDTDQIRKWQGEEFDPMTLMDEMEEEGTPRKQVAEKSEPSKVARKRRSL